MVDNKIDKKLLGQRIKQIRQELGENLEVFGERFDPPANRSLVSAWENGRYIPNGERLRIIADLANISVKELLLPSSQSLEQYAKDKIDEIVMHAQSVGVDPKLANSIGLDLKLSFFHPLASPISEMFDSYDEIDERFEEKAQRSYENLTDPEKRYYYLLGELRHKVLTAFEEYEAYFKKQSYESIKESDPYPWGNVEGAPIELLEKVQELKKDTISKIDDISNEYDK